jgi:predicted transcriptional regulator
MLERVETEITILERHCRVLEAVAEREPVGPITLTNRLSYPRHEIRGSLRLLESEALADSTASGYTTTDRVPEFGEQLDWRLDEFARRLNCSHVDTGLLSAVNADSVAAD